ncbi:MAG TPA: cyclic nucleotide-binding domain-containing protein [Actinomycetota bacterium]
MARGIPHHVIRYFEAVPMFGSVSKGGIRALIQAATEVDLPPGKDVVREGDTDQDLFVIIAGALRVSRRGRRIGDLGTGDFFGELAFLSRGQRTATVTTTSETRLMVLGARDFRSVVEREPKLALQVLEAAATRLRELDRRSL